MKALFADSETFQKERPTKITEQQEKDYFEKVAKEIIKNQWTDYDLEDVIHDVSRISANDSGYEIAKELEGYNSKASYEIDTPFIEYLDDFGYRKSEILRDNIKLWVTAHNPKPKFKLGEKLNIHTSLNREQKAGDTIYVTGFNEDEARYILNKDSAKIREGFLINYEKVEECCSAVIQEP